MPAEALTTNSPRNSDRGFALFVSTLALVMSMGALLAVAFKMNDSGTQSGAATPMATGMAGHMAGGGASTPAAAAETPVEDVKILVKSDEEQGKLGPEGAWHDAFLPADFSVKAGSVVRVTVYNYDEGEHTFTAPGLEANVVISAGTESKPSKTTFTFRAPPKAGRYEWFCALPCDPWAMHESGYMRGYVTVT
jgi:plastocyanin